jgi:hypothetical protein
MTSHEKTTPSAVSRKTKGNRNAKTEIISNRAVDARKYDVLTLNA